MINLYLLIYIYRSVLVVYNFLIILNSLIKVLIPLINIFELLYLILDFM